MIHEDLVLHSFRPEKSLRIGLSETPYPATPGSNNEAQLCPKIRNYVIRKCIFY